MHEKRPWLRHYGDIPTTLNYPRTSLYETLMQSVALHSEEIAWDFFGKTQTYRNFSETIHKCANGLAALGLEAGDRITIAMPTCPQGIIVFYAVNCLGAVANIIHPLATIHEIESYLNTSQSRIAVTLDAYFPKFNAARKKTPLKKIVLTKISDYLPFCRKIKFALLPRCKQAAIPSDKWIVKWAELFDPNHPRCIPVPTNTDAPAVILYSGGTTGTPKGTLLSNHNLIAAGLMASAWADLCRGDRILAILPLFHGFGLSVGINAAFMSGARSILALQFSPETVVNLIRKKQPNFIFALPGLFHALTQNSKFRKTDTHFLKAAFCGADTLPKVVKERFEKIIAKNGGNVRIQEGYGLAETVTVVMGNPAKGYRDGSIGLPFPDMLAKIVRPGTDEELACGFQGELCLHGPTVMLGYLNQSDETAGILKKHRDGKIWLHTEDLCSMDNDGYFYFHLKLKRIINSSGISISPIQVEDRLLKYPDVLETCEIGVSDLSGVPDLSMVEKIKAFVVLKKTPKAGTEFKKII